MYVIACTCPNSRVSEVEEAMAAGAMTPLDRRGTAVGCFVLGRCLQLGHAVSRNEQKAEEYFIKVRAKSECVLYTTDCKPLHVHVAVYRLVLGYSWTCTDSFY